MSRHEPFRLTLMAVVFVLGCADKTPRPASQAMTPTPQATTPASQATTAVPQATPLALPPAGSLNLVAFPYDRKEVFRSTMETRLTYMDQGSRALRARANETAAATGSATIAERMENFEDQFEIAQDRLGELDAVEPQNWEGYKRRLRDEISALEQAYQQLQIATRE